MRIVTYTLSILVALVLAVAARAQDESPFDRARQLVQARDFAGAEKVLDQLTRVEKDNAPAWLLLGQARMGQQKYDAALLALDRALAFPATRAGALREAFLARAARGDGDSAWPLWTEIAHNAWADLSSLHLRPELAGLKDDRRFEALFPDDFATPLADGRRPLHDWRGEGPGHEFGWEARAIGDVDGDGITDAVVSAPGNQPGADASGLVYVYSGASGRLLWLDKGEPGDRLGMGIEGAGDVDADGVPDVIVGAPGIGRAYVYAGRTGLVLLTLKGDQADGSGFGGSVATAGDLDGDGHDDVLVGASGADEGAGRAYAFSGHDGRTLAQWQGTEAGDAFGSVVAGHRDASGLLLAIGAPGAGAENRGRVYVYRDTGREPAFVIDADDTGRALGQMFVSVVGDVDADGTPDIYASDWANQARGRRTGRIYVHSGRTGARLLTLTGEAAGDGFGIGPARAGDVDGDGHADLVIGAWQHSSGAPSGGKVYVYSGRTGQLLEQLTGRIGGATLGFDADGLGDVDGDGRFDYLVTSAWSLVRGVRSGRTLVIPGTVERVRHGTESSDDDGRP